MPGLWGRPRGRSSCWAGALCAPRRVCLFFLPFLFVSFLSFLSFFFSPPPPTSYHLTSRSHRTHSFPWHPPTHTNPQVTLEVSAASGPAREALASAGGSLRTVYYNRLGLRALLKPEAFDVETREGGVVRVLPRPARPPPRLAGKYDVTGELPPRREIQPPPGGGSTTPASNSSLSPSSRGAPAGAPA